MGPGGGQGGSGARPGEFWEEEVSAPPLLLGSQLPAASATFLPLGGQGLGAQHIPVQTAGQEDSLPLPLRAPDDLGFLGWDTGPAEDIRVSLCWRACGHMPSHGQAFRMGDERLVDKASVVNRGAL